MCVPQRMDWRPISTAWRSMQRTAICSISLSRATPIGALTPMAARWLREGRADLIAYGRKFLANPDLPERLRLGAALNADDPSTYYGGGEKGYTDYRSLAQDRGEQPKACVDQSWR